MYNNRQAVHVKARIGTAKYVREKFLLEAEA